MLLVAFSSLLTSSGFWAMASSSLVSIISARNWGSVSVLSSRFFPCSCSMYRPRASGCNKTAYALFTRAEYCSDISSSSCCVTKLSYDRTQTFNILTSKYATGHNPKAANFLSSERILLPLIIKLYLYISGLASTHFPRVFPTKIKYEYSYATHTNKI